ncbi:chromosomal replication initiator protein DnaA [Desulfobotulus sp. H1]|uniref:Chromosomal replication initiator protein DnaA n=1 Tax=Desulfobotulus pelophilus TaxID=2823377 RepID=A0ABT3N644_9BACT|nr:chromosomal replication initiator protein DnaA [Desulfobotulus pelophilus]MCW7752930.1 chromosomal replication initiator protein DnaA [Desulfobotulus pelophilus]
MDAIIWDSIKARIKEHVPAHSYRMWIEPIGLGFCKDDTVELTCANSFSQKRIRDHYGSLIRNEVEQHLGKPLELSFAVAEKAEAFSSVTRTRSAKTVKAAAAEKQMELPQISSRLHSGRMLRRDFTFDRFVVGQNCDLAYSAALSLAARRGGHLKTLFLSSHTGMGKSHLSQAVGHHILNTSPTERIYYVTAEDFTNEMVGALRSGSMDLFKEKYRTQCDVLLMEDVHFLTGKDRTQQELAMTLDYLFEADKKIIFSGSALPADIPKLNDQLRSRLSSGLVSPIEKPDFQTRVRILKTKCREHSMDMPMRVMEYLAGELEDNVRQLESGLIGVAAKHSLLGSSIDLSLAESVVKNIVCHKRQITVEGIKGLVCREFGVSPEEIMSKSRKQNIVRSRQMGMYLSRKYTDQSIQAIGRSFNRYHATAIHSINMVEKALREKTAVARQFEVLCKRIEAGDL